MSKFTNNRIYDTLFVQGRMPDKCLLCGTGELEEKGHIIPKFVMRWLKKASNKNEFFLNNDPLLKVSDTPALKIMCTACEDKVSLFEKHFTDNYYKRYYRRKKVEQFTDEVYYFAVSVAWRLIVSTERLKSTAQDEFAQSYGGMEQRARAYLLDTSKKPELDVYILSAEQIFKTVDAGRIKENLLNYSVSHGLKAHSLYDSKHGFMMTPLPIPTVSFKIGAYYFFVVMSHYFEHAEFQVNCIRRSKLERLFEVNCTEDFLGFAKWIMNDRFYEVEVSMMSSEYYSKRNLM
ncbi:hypothetical protein J2Y83_000572 [Pseudomonas marginalis]|uniref:hypothetical protein n=1 Tax=Pseudomonas marginalis TaxID=298 RepID=UPI00209C80B0|nr:hypothetical protein [Pseudomonas marginalis]MCP1510445.1 hypothetical protein [Pseudomonas marginalis]MCP1522103.1 hypothetical protein [Pseudomonas marginalis]MDQ0501093.1 hypothetical protein [Pseudomonas marginalis]